MLRRARKEPNLVIKDGFWKREEKEKGFRENQKGSERKEKGRCAPYL